MLGGFLTTNADQPDVGVHARPRRDPNVVDHASHVARDHCRKRTQREPPALDGGQASARREGNTTANEQFVRRLVVWPDVSAVDVMVDRWPFFPDGIIDSATFKQFIGVSAAVEQKT